MSALIGEALSAVRGTEHLRRVRTFDNVIFGGLSTYAQYEGPSTGKDGQGVYVPGPLQDEAMAEHTTAHLEWPSVRRSVIAAKLTRLPLLVRTVTAPPVFYVHERVVVPDDDPAILAGSLRHMCHLVTERYKDAVDLRLVTASNTTVVRHGEGAGADSFVFGYYPDGGSIAFTGDIGRILLPGDPGHRQVEMFKEGLEGSALPRAETIDYLMDHAQTLDPR
jgi:hypothetical protein